MKTNKQGGQPVFENMNDVVNSVEEFDTFAELQSQAQKAKNYTRTWGIGFKIKSFKKEGKINIVRKILQDFLDADFEPEGGAGALKQKIKDEVVTYKDGKPNFSDYEIERVARTELSSMRELNKLLEWKKEGFTKVKHKTLLSENTGKKDREFNNRVFEIDYLLKNEEDRIPLHPNCRCLYVVEG